MGLSLNVLAEIEHKFDLHPYTAISIVDNNGIYSKFL
jgi:hypothetical protein